MSSYHTPGPWEWDGASRVEASAFRSDEMVPDGEGGEIRRTCGLVALVYAPIPERATWSDVHDGNGRVIAAAPWAPHRCCDPECPGGRLLTALRAALDVMLQHAIGTECLMCVAGPPDLVHETDCPYAVVLAAVAKAEGRS